MLARNAIILRWSLYAAAAMLCLFLQGAVFQRVSIWGVIPFLFPALAAVPATFEAPASSTAYALCLGAVCDLLLPVPIPCFYTLIFPVVGLCSALLAQGILPAGMGCSLVSTVAAFLLTDLFNCLLLWFRGQNVWAAGLSTMVRECLVTLPLAIPMTWLFRLVYRRGHRDE